MTRLSCILASPRAARSFGLALVTYPTSLHLVPVEGGYQISADDPAVERQSVTALAEVPVSY